MTHLYYIGSDDCGHNLDLVVEATSKEQAIELWREYYELETFVQPDRVWLLPDKTGIAHAVEWHSQMIELVPGQVPS